MLIRPATNKEGLRVDRLTVSHGRRVVLEDVSFTLPHGRLLAVLGPSGAGKSTLLAALAGFERPTSGSITFDGADWSGIGAADREIGMSFEDAALHEHLTVEENLELAALPRDEPRARIRSRIAALTGTLRIEPLLGRKPATLSAGERRRVALGRAFIRSPELALLDEPLTNLDCPNRYAIRQLVRGLQRSTKSAAIVVTHDPGDALAIADDALVLIGGRVRAHGPMRDLSRTPPDLEVAQIVDELGMFVIELDRNGAAPDLMMAPTFVERILAARDRAGADGSILLGIRPWHVRVSAPSEPSIALDAHLAALEPAGLFMDALGRRPDHRVLRARLPETIAQKLPVGEDVRFHVHEADVHCFAGPWPGRRLELSGA